MSAVIDDLEPAHETAARLRIQPQTLAVWRVKGIGPPFHKIGFRVMYRVSEVQRWLEQTRRTSTSDPGPDRAA